MPPRNDRAWGRGLIAAAFAAVLACVLPSAAAQTPGSEVQEFLEALWPMAHARGVSRVAFERAMAHFTPDPDVIELAMLQPEHEKSPGTYVTELVSQARVDAGRKLALAHSALLASIEATYGVDRHVLLAIWGVESLYGTQMGSRNIVRSLATLAMTDARRAPFWRRELIAALRILQDGAIAPEKLVGSWAGAMGHTQFLPTTYVTRAVDFDGDGRRDIWGTVADALASSANYLRLSGWVAGNPWGFEVALPNGFDYAALASGPAKTLAEWQAAGVTMAGRQVDVPPGLALQLRLPAGARGPAFLVSGNFRALLKYNQSAAYALAVGHLADRLAGAPALATAWPANDKGLSRVERQELQTLLGTRGFDTGGIDGIIGDRTRDAIRATQRSFNLDEDGHANHELLQRLRASAGP